MTILHRIDQWTHFWLSRKMAPENQLRLNLRRIYILPSRLGLAVLLMGFVLFLFGTNYQNNLVLLLSFFIFSLFITLLLLSCLNLSGIELTPQAANSVAAKQYFNFPLQLKTKKGKIKEGLRFSWSEQYPSDSASKTHLDYLSGQTTIEFDFFAEQRGSFHPAWLCVTSYAPLGFFRAWAVMRVEAQSWAYPEPMEGPLPLTTVLEGHHQDGDAQDQDWQALNEYQTGDNLSRIYWRRFALNQELWTRGEPIEQFEEALELAMDDIILDYHSPAFTGFNKEKRLSILCHWVLYMQQHNKYFALKLDSKQLGGKQLASGSGNAHCLKALKLLAMA